jgi:hypothetical protein
VTTKTHLSTLVGEALRRFRREPNHRPGDPVRIEQIGSVIEEITGERLPNGGLAEIKEDMRLRQAKGQGVRCLSTSAEVWSIEPWFDDDEE